MEILESQILSFEFKTIVFLAGRSISYKDKQTSDQKTER